MTEACFVDSNLFLRFLTNDVPQQAEDVERLLHRAAVEETTLVTNAMVVAEIVWVLESFYKLNRPSILEKVLGILNTPGLFVDDAEVVLQATLWHAEKEVDFIDAYNVAWMQSHEIETAYTFDQRHFSRFEGITVVVPGKPRS